MKKFCFHTHTDFCDGEGTPREFIERAIELGMSIIGFSAHSPLPFETACSMKNEQYESYCNEIRKLSEEYRNKIEIYISLELDFIPNNSYSFYEMKERGNLDYTIGSVHMVANNNKLWFLDGHELNYIKGLDEIFNGNIRLAVKNYYNQIKEMLITQKPDIVGHIDKIKMNNKNRFFSEDEKWYQSTIDEMLDCIVRTGTIVEVNTRGIYKKKSNDLFPGIPILENCYMRKIPVTISVDAHHPNELLKYFDETQQILKNIGYREVCVFSQNKWKYERL